MQTLMALGEKADRAGVPDGMDVPAEIARREQRLKAIERAKAQIEQRARERLEAEQREHQAKLKRRQAQRDAGKKPCGKDPEPPQEGPRDSDQVSLTDEDSRIMPVSGGGFEQSYNAQAAVDTETMLVIGTAMGRLRVHAVPIERPEGGRSHRQMAHGLARGLPERWGSVACSHGDDAIAQIANDM